jgi:hypothetical protein
MLRRAGREAAAERLFSCSYETSTPSSFRGAVLLRNAVQDCMTEWLRDARDECPR